MTRGEIAGWAIWIGGWLAFGSYYAYQAHDPAVIAKANAQRAQEELEAGQTLTRAGCSSDMEYRDDGTMPAETVAKAIIAKCGAVIQFHEGSCSATCMREMPRIALKVETDNVLRVRYERAQARADDAKAALERARPH